MARNFSHLTDVQLDEAFKLFEKLVVETGRNALATPSPAWDSVYERLQESLDDYRAELARRTQSASAQSSAMASQQGNFDATS